MPNQVFISVNIFLCLIITFLSVLPQVQENNPYEAPMKSTVGSNHSFSVCPFQLVESRSSIGDRFLFDVLSLVKPVE